MAAPGPFITNSLGAASQASGGGSSAFGLGSIASANDSSALGEFSKASGAGSVAIGLFGTATGTSSIALGRASKAGGTHNNSGTVAIGAGAQAGAGVAGQSNATAVGINALANAASSAAFGHSSKASGGYSVALGRSASASSARSVAIGYASVANASDTVSVGSAGHERRITNVANAVKTTDAVNLGQVKALIAKGAPQVAALAPAPIGHGAPTKGVAMVSARANAGQRTAALTAAGGSSGSRLAGDDGAYAWGVFEDAAEAGRMVETFLVESWLEHLRQHERVTNADRVLQETVHRFQVEGTPKITHLIAAEPGPAAAEAKSA